MPTGENQKLKLFYLNKIMLEKTDDEHGLTIHEIISELEKYGVNAERKSIYRDFEVLTENFGTEIVVEKEGRQYYYQVGNKQFELAELKLLVDAVQSSNFITERKSAALIKKITGFASKYEASQLKRQVLVQGKIKTMNESIYYNVDELYNAIAKNSAIHFHYLQWNTDKKLIPKNKKDSDEIKEYEVSPWTLLWDDERYYLVAYDHEEEKIKHFRVDKMDKISLTGGKRLGKEAYDNSDPSQYAKKNFGMFAGEEATVRIEFPEEKVGIFLDQFGKDIIVVPSDREGFYKTNVDVYTSDHFFGWIFAIGPDVKITAPEHIVEKYKSAIKKRLEQV